MLHFQPQSVPVQTQLLTNPLTSLPKNLQWKHFSLHHLGNYTFHCGWLICNVPQGYIILLQGTNMHLLGVDKLQLTVLPHCQAVLPCKAELLNLITRKSQTGVWSRLEINFAGMWTLRARDENPCSKDTNLHFFFVGSNNPWLMYFFGFTVYLWRSILCRVGTKLQQKKECFFSQWWTPTHKLQWLFACGSVFSPYWCLLGY